MASQGTGGNPREKTGNNLSSAEAHITHHQSPRASKKKNLKARLSPSPSLRGRRRNLDWAGERIEAPLALPTVALRSEANRTRYWRRRQPWVGVEETRKERSPRRRLYPGKERAGGRGRRRPAGRLGGGGDEGPEGPAGPDSCSTLESPACAHLWIYISRRALNVTLNASARRTLEMPPACHEAASSARNHHFFQNYWLPLFFTPGMLNRERGNRQFLVIFDVAVLYHLHNIPTAALSYILKVALYEVKLNVN